MKKSQPNPQLVNLLSLTWGKDQKMIDHCLKNYVYIQIDDMFVDICTSKPTITKTIWYDDEREAPDNTWETFLDVNSYNIQKDYELEKNIHGEKNHLCICVQYWNDKTNGKLTSLQYKSDSDDQEFVIRKVTEEELIIINNAVKEARDNYLKRLENYYNKYKDKISIRGYWVNR